jgi:hypothetical protein
MQAEIGRAIRRLKRILRGTGAKPCAAIVTEAGANCGWGA